MARIRYTNTFFNVGFVNSSVHGNVKFEQYNDALLSCINAQQSPTGGLFKRCGTVLVGETKTQSKKSRLFQFAYDSETDYIIEIGHLYIRVIDKNGYVLDDSPVPVPIEYETTITEDQLSSLLVEQISRSLYIITGTSINTLVRTEEALFEYVEGFTFTVPPMTQFNMDPVSLKPDATSGNITITCVDSTNPSVKPDAVFAPFFYDSDVGQLMRLVYDHEEETPKPYYLYISSIADDTGGFKKVVATIDTVMSYSDALPSTDPCQAWFLSTFTADRGFPKAMCTFNGRVFFANTTDFPVGIWGSSLTYNDKMNFDLGKIQSGDSLTFNAMVSSADELLWIAPQTKLFIGSKGGVYIAGGAAAQVDSPITPTNFDIRLLTSIGSSNIKPISVLDAVFFVDYSRTSVHSITLAPETGTFIVNNLSLLSSDATKDKILRHCWQQSPKNTYWCVTDTGQLISMTYNRNNQVLSWSEFHKLGGTGTVVEDCCIYRYKGQEYVMLLVRRDKIGEQGFVRTIEYINHYDPVSSEQFKQYYVDCGAQIEKKGTVTNVTQSRHARRLNVDGTNLSAESLCLFVSDSSSHAVGLTSAETAIFKMSIDNLAPGEQIDESHLYNVTLKSFVAPDLTVTGDPGLLNTQFVETGTIPFNIFHNRITTNSRLYVYTGVINEVVNRPDSHGPRMLVKCSPNLLKVKKGSYIRFSSRFLTLYSAREYAITELGFTEIEYNQYCNDFRESRYNEGEGFCNFKLYVSALSSRGDGFYLKKVDPATGATTHIDVTTWPAKAFELWKASLLYVDTIGGFTSETFINSVDTYVTLEENVADILGAETEGSVYLNKIPGMTELSSEKYMFHTQELAPKDITLLTQDKFVLCGDASPVWDVPPTITTWPTGAEIAIDVGARATVDTTNMQYFDSTSVANGNAYFYFQNIVIPDTLSKIAKHTAYSTDIAICANGADVNMSLTDIDMSTLTIRLPAPAMYVSLGLLYTMAVETVDFVGGSMFGDSDGTRGYIKESAIRLYYSRGGRYATSLKSYELGDAYDVKYPDSFESDERGLITIDKPMPLFSGLINLTMSRTGDTHERKIAFVHDSPVGFNILSLTRDVVISDE